eukprot:jgi/Mesen1/10679/ME000009S10465
MGRSRGPATVDDDALTFGSRRSLYHCNYCQKDITGTVRIKCAKCADFDLCVECFSVGVEITPHKNNHPYHVMDNLNFPLFQSDWNADEEILLLEGIEMYGLGNWGEVAEHVCSKTRVQCFDHYMAAYMCSPCSPLPDLSHVMARTKVEILGAGSTKVEVQEKAAVQATLLREKSLLALSKLEPGSTGTAIKVEEVKEEDLSGSAGGGASERSPATEAGKGPPGWAAVKGQAATPSDREASDSLTAGRKVLAQVGSPGKGGKKSAAVQQKDKEEAQEGGAQAAAGGNELQSKRTLGGQQAKPLPVAGAGGAEQDPLGGGAAAAAAEQTGYNAKRNEFDPEYDNDAESPLAEMEFKDSDSPADRELKVRMLHIYLARLEERKRRKEFILERGLLNMKKQQALERQRSREERELYHRGRVFARYLSPRDHEALLAGLNAERKIRRRIEELQEYRRAGCRTLEEARLYDADKQRRDDLGLLKKQPREGGGATSVGGGGGGGGKMNQRSNRYQARERGDAEGPGPGPGSVQRVRAGGGGGGSGGAGGAGADGAALKKETAAALDVSGHLGADLLSSREREMCSQLRLLPVHYLKMKEVLVAESTQKGALGRDQALRFFKVDPAKVGHVFDFLLSKGWIQASPTQAQTQGPGPAGKREGRDRAAPVGGGVGGGGGGSDLEP